MLTLRQVKERIKADPENWRIHLMDFVDDLRYYRDPQMIAEPFVLDNERIDALLAATAEQLCEELKIQTPVWILSVPAPRDPWFVSEMESLKAIAIVESPLPFRIRKLFVLENFLSRG
ncbi:MAG: hypothetical protein J2P41_02365 [Blastocatellia bacterium]|nr:hypothetical protein [Blastocatellia bacterium]